jgi:dihydroorotase
MTYDLILRNGTLFSSKSKVETDIAIQGGKIAEIGNLAHAKAKETLDVKGLAVFPGLIDTQVHFREPGMEHKEDIQSGTQSAAAGGVTTVLEMPNTVPPTTTPEALADKLNRARGRAWCNIGFFVGASPENVEMLAEYENLPGTPGIKIFMGSSTGSLLVPDDDTLRRVLLSGKKRTPVHAEDHVRLEERKALISLPTSPEQHPFLRDAEAACIATRRLLALSQETGRPVHILHISTGEEPTLIAEARAKGIRCTAEVTPQHLYFAAPECYRELGTLAQMNPPIRDASHRDALRKALKAGVFDVFGSDHAPHTLEEKAQPYPKSPSGMPGVQTLLPVLLTLASEGLITVHDIVRMACETPAKLYAIKGKGFIEPGADADITVVDIEKRWTLERSWIKSKCGWSPYEGQTLTGLPVHTLVNGKVALRDGQLSHQPAGTIPEFGPQS